MSFGFNPQQQPPGMFPGINQLEERVHPVVPYALGGIGTIGGYVWGIQQDTLPVALCIGIGVVVGLLLVPLLLKTASLFLAIVIVAGAALATFFLLSNDAALKHRPAVHRPAPQSDGEMNGDIWGRRI